MAELFLPNHPDAPNEMRHLQTVCDKIEGEIARMEGETGVGAEEERVVAVPQDATMDEMVALDLFRRKVDMLRALGKARHQAYFARLDFIPRGAGQETHYLGRWGVVTQPEYDTVVVDWRAPLANLYYSGQVGPASYAAPDGSVQGEMTLKRLLTVRDRQLSGIFDSGLVSQDAYLQSVLGQVSGERLKEIVTTIQAEQNQVIRHEARENLIVQGVAGSGKTTIALHRIAWLLYAFQDTLKPEQLMILAPNPLFLDYISQVLPDLGVERVVQTTFAGLCEKLLGKALPKLAPTSRLEDKLTASPEQRAAMKRVLRRKGSLAFKRDVESFLDLWQRELIPRDMTFGNVRLMTRDELENIFLTQLKPFPLEKRIDETKKYVKKRLTSVCEQMKRQLLEMTETRLTHLLSSLPDGEERRARAAKLFASRDERMNEVDEHAKQYMKAFRGLWPSLKLCDVYAECLRRTCDEEVCAATLPYVEKNKAHMEDLAALTVIGRAVVGVKPTGIRHVLVDECQDFSPFQVKLCVK